MDIYIKRQIGYIQAIQKKEQILVAMMEVIQGIIQKTLTTKQTGSTDHQSTDMYISQVVNYNVKSGKKC